MRFAGVSAGGEKDGVQHLRSGMGSFATRQDCLHEAIHTEFFAAVIHGFGEAVAVADEPVAGIEFHRMRDGREGIK